MKWAVYYIVRSLLLRYKLLVAPLNKAGGSLRALQGLDIEINSLLDKANDGLNFSRRLDGFV
jgi:hypothetical protein